MRGEPLEPRSDDVVIVAAPGVAGDRRPGRIGRAVALVVVERDAQTERAPGRTRARVEALRHGGAPGSPWCAAWPASSQRRSAGAVRGRGGRPDRARDRSPGSSACALTESVSAVASSVMSSAGAPSAHSPSSCAGLHEQVAAGERAPARLEERDVAKPAAVGLPAVLEPHRRGQTLLDRGEAALTRARPPAPRPRSPRGRARRACAPRRRRSARRCRSPSTGRRGRRPARRSARGRAPRPARSMIASEAKRWAVTRSGAARVVVGAVDVGLVELDVAEARRGGAAPGLG